jgi:hypothetical protein
LRVVAVLGELNEGLGFKPFIPVLSNAVNGDVRIGKGEVFYVDWPGIMVALNRINCDWAVLEVRFYYIGNINSSLFWFIIWVFPDIMSGVIASPEEQIRLHLGLHVVQHVI